MEWAYDASTSRLLWLLAHLPVVGIGGVVLTVARALGVAVVLDPGQFDVGTLLLVGLLILIGGPFSLAYLWPMLTDPDQRPSVTEFEGADGFPFTACSVVSAAVLGAIGIVSLVALDVSVSALYWVIVALVFAPILVAVLTTRGQVRDSELVINATNVPLTRVTGIIRIEIVHRRVDFVRDPEWCLAPTTGSCPDHPCRPRRFDAEIRYRALVRPQTTRSGRSRRARRRGTTVRGGRVDLNDHHR